MNWNCVRYIPGSSSFDGPAPIKTIMDTSGGVYPFNTYLMLVNAGDDYRFWQARVWLYVCYSISLYEVVNISNVYNYLCIIHRVFDILWEQCRAYVCSAAK